MTPLKTAKKATKATKATTGKAGRRGEKRPAKRPATRSVTRSATRAAASPEAVEAQLTAIERGPGEGELELGGGVTLHVSSLGKVYFPGAGITKGALMRYYTRLSPVLLPQLAGR